MIQKKIVVRRLCEIRTKRVFEKGGYIGSYENDHKDIWDNFMTEKEKKGYSFKQIYDYMENS